MENRMRHTTIISSREQGDSQFTMPVLCAIYNAGWPDRC